MIVGVGAEHEQQKNSAPRPVGGRRGCDREFHAEPKPQTSGAKSDGRFGKQDFVYLPEQDAYRCPAGEQLPYRLTSEVDGKRLRRYWTTACQDCSLKSQCTTGPERRIPRWEHEHLLEAVQQRLDANSQAMRQRRETVEHPFGTMKARMGATHFLTKMLCREAPCLSSPFPAANSRVRRTDRKYRHRTSGVERAEEGSVCGGQRRRV
jgi:hypothetical protein